MSKKLNHCDIKLDKIVNWTIYKENIKDVLIGTNLKKNGLLYLDYEAAGEINFINQTCKVYNSEIEGCHKHTVENIKYKKGSTDSVITPHAIVNFHTHPLSCYVQAKTIWGWPSGEDLARSIEFALNNNVCHIVFAIEGTYIININNELVNKINNVSSTLIQKIIDNVENIMQLTHKFRMYENDNNVSLETEFNSFFLKHLGLNSEKLIIYNWIKLVNNLDIQKLIILNNLCINQFGNNFTTRLNISDFNIKFCNDLNKKIFKISFIKNNTIQWNKYYLENKKELFDILKESKFNLNIKLPNKIVYKAPFISQSCKLSSK